MTLKFPKPKKSKTKSLKEKCIALSGRISTSGGNCCSCKRSKFTGSVIFPSHIVSRRYARTAARIDNILPQCERCASYYTAHPIEWNALVDNLFPGRRLMLEAVARVNKKVDWAEMLKSLTLDAKVLGIK